MRPLAAAATGPAGLEHLQHPLGDDVTTDGVTRSEQDAASVTDLVMEVGEGILAQHFEPSDVCALPSATIAPTSTIPCTKFDPDMRGVCRITGTREITS